MPPLSVFHLLCQLRKWIRNLEGTAQACILEEDAAWAAAKPDGAPAAKRARMFVSIPAAEACVEQHSLLVPPMLSLELSLSSPSPPETPQYETSCSSSMCRSPFGSPNVDGNRAAVVEPLNTAANHGSLCQQVSAGRWGDARVVDSTASLVKDQLRSQLLAVAQPLPPDMLALDELPQGQATTCPQGTIAYARQDCVEQHQEACVDVMLMGSLLHEDALVDDTSDPPGWVQDWLRELMDDGC